MFRRMIYVPTLAVLVGLSLVGAGAEQAQAGLLPTLLSVTPDSGNFMFFYSVEVPSSNVVKPGDSFTVYDFAGLDPSSITISAAQGTWTWAVANTTPPPPGLSVTDNASVPNITFTFEPAPSSDIPGPAGVTFSANSTFDGVYTPPDGSNEFNVASSTHRQNGGQENAVTSTGVPIDNGTSQTPEPATLAMMGIGLPVLQPQLQFFRRRRAARVG